MPDEISNTSQRALDLHLTFISSSPSNTKATGFIYQKLHILHPTHASIPFATLLHPLQSVLLAVQTQTCSNILLVKHPQGALQVDVHRFTFVCGTVVAQWLRISQSRGCVSVDKSQNTFCGVVCALSQTLTELI